MRSFIPLGDRPWVRRLMNALLDYDKNATVVVVDWRGGSTPPYVKQILNIVSNLINCSRYYQAVANIRLIGAITAHVVFSIFVSLT